MARPRVQRAHLPLLPAVVGAHGAVGDDQLWRHTTRLGDEALAVVRLEVAVEVAREHPVEGAVLEGQPAQGVALEERAGGDALARDREHLLALVEPGDLAPQVPSEKARAAGDVERARGWERSERPRQLLDGLIPSGPVPPGEQALPEIPLVVLGRARVVVVLHA